MSESNREQVSPLDDPQFVMARDPSGMYDLTLGFPAQCRKALALAREVELAPLSKRPRNVVIAGLGGSAAGGDFARALADALGNTPVAVSREYSVPNWVDEESLVLACSYSGNTEETLAAFQDARTKGARLACVTSGGKLREFAEDAHLPLFAIPPGQPPRTAMGYMLIPVLWALESWGLLPALDYEAAFLGLESDALRWAVESPEAGNEAKRISQTLLGSVGLIYGLGAWQGVVASRWCAQIEENAKNLAFSATFPELNHNQVLGWVRAGDQRVARWVVVLLEDGDESAKMKARARVTLELIQDRATILRTRASGGALLEKMLRISFLGDFVSLYLAALNGVDPENIDWINVLKSELAKVPQSSESAAP